MNAPYQIAACQPRTRLVFDETGTFQSSLLEQNVEHYCDLIRRAATENDVKLIVFPQFGLSGYKPVEIPDWIEASIRFPGPETKRIGQAAKSAGAYVVVAATERHEAFPGRYFSSAAVIAPDGDVAMVYRKNYVLSTRTRPIDVADDFVREFGPDSFQPVLDTPLGRIGIAIAGEVYWPEVVRSLALKGAEIIVNPTSAPPQYYYHFRPTGALVRPVRAFENLVYLAFSNVGAIVTPTGGDPAAPEGAWPESEVYDFKGAAIGVGEKGGNRFTTAVIDLDALRAARADAGANFIAQLQPSIHDDEFARAQLWPTNRFLDHPIAAQSELRDIELEVWNRLISAGRAVA
jgi:predicted amidohydrolase